MKRSFEGISYSFVLMFYFKSIKVHKIRNIIYLFRSIQILKNTNLFNLEYYLLKNPILVQYHINPYFHYLYYGGFNGEKPSKDFDSAFYLEHYDDVKHSKMNPLVHYILFGKKEIRVPYENYYEKIMHLDKYGQKYKYRSFKFKKGIKRFKYKPLFSIIIIFEDNIELLVENISSIRRQWYSKWDIHIVHDSKLSPKSILDLLNFNVRKKIKFAESENIAFGIKRAMQHVEGDYIVLLRGKDLITRDALFESCDRINNIESDLIFSDEEIIDEKIESYNPYYKPDYSYDMLLSQNYFGCFAIVNRNLFNSIDILDCDRVELFFYDLFLKATEKTSKIEHIQKILCHNRDVVKKEITKPMAKKAQDEGKTILKNHLKRINSKVNVSDGLIDGTYRVWSSVSGNPLVSIIIPFKDKIEVLKVCIKSIVEKTTYKNIEILCVSNNSEEKRTFEEINELKKLDDRISFFEYNVPFNYSKINNYAVKNYSKGEYIVLLNNDIEIITKMWVENMLGFAQREDVGAVGAKLYYQNDSIQSAGIMIGMFDVVGEPHKFFNRSSPGYFGRLMINQNISAVTGAFLMVSKSKYINSGALDEERFVISYNDVDFCLRLIKMGYKNIFTPFVEAYHYESLSRGRDLKEEYIKELKSLIELHEDIIEKGDKYYNPNLPKNRQDFIL